MVKPAFSQAEIFLPAQAVSRLGALDWKTMSQSMHALFNQTGKVKNEYLPPSSTLVVRDANSFSSSESELW